jgi:LPXTG-motif cell wall-anchored protein
MLPRTGQDLGALALAAVGVVLVGVAALDAGRHRVRSAAAIGHHGGRGNDGRGGCGP